MFKNPGNTWFAPAVTITEEFTIFFSFHNCKTKRKKLLDNVLANLQYQGHVAFGKIVKAPGISISNYVNSSPKE